MYRKIRRYFIKKKIARTLARLEDGQFILDGEFLIGLRKKGEDEMMKSDEEKAKWIGYVNAINEVIRYVNTNE